MCVRKCMWVVLSQQNKGLSASCWRLMKSFAALDEVVVAGLHALAGQRAGVLDLLLADLAPARLDGRDRPCRSPSCAARRAAGTASGSSGNLVG